MVCFFFSSRRRHTRFDCDWSSDVCSSDLALTKLGLLNEDLDYHLIRASMVLLFLFFGYQKWFEYEAQVLIPDRKSTRLNSSHSQISYAVFCLKKKKLKAVRPHGIRTDRDT